MAIFCLSCGEPRGQTPPATPANDSTDRIVGGPCDRCSEMFYAGKPSDKSLTNELTLAQPSEPGERLEVSGVVMKQDGKSPASDVVIYIYHTNAAGLYAPSDTQTIGRLNGHLRGWLKTGSDGSFQVHTIRPAPYPGRSIPAHLHLLVKEPGMIPYYIDEVWFDDDAFVTRDLRSKAEKRGGDLIIHLTKNENSWFGNLTILLGKNIPGY